MSVNVETLSTSGGGYDSSFDKTDRKISAHATLQTPPTRTSFPGDDNKKFVPKAIPGKEKKKFHPKNLENFDPKFLNFSEEDNEHPKSPSSSSPVIHSKSKSLVTKVGKRDGKNVFLSRFPLMFFRKMVTNFLPVFRLIYFYYVHTKSNSWS